MDSIKAPAKEKVGILGTLRDKPRFNEKCSGLANTLFSKSKLPNCRRLD